MCGRYSLARPARLDPKAFGVEAFPDLPPRYNIAPTQDVLAVLEHDATRSAELLRWGLVPGWAKDPAVGARMANARAETVAEKPSFRNAFRSRRCLVPADGFYEWQVVPGAKRKQPHRIRMADDEPFAFAGLWESWRPAAKSADEAAALRSCALLTTAPNALMRPIHDRMPVIVAPDDYDAWLDPATPPADVLALLRSFPAERMVAHPVSTAVNSPHHDEAGCIAPLSEA